MEENIITKVYKAGLRFLEPLTTEETYKTISDEAVKLVGADFASIILEQDGELKKVYSSSPIGYKIKNRKKGNTNKAFQTGKPIIAHISDMEKAHPVMKERGIISSIFIPLSYHGHSIGVLVVNSFKNEKFTQKELDILTLFGSQAILAIRKTQLYEETRKAVEVRDLFISMASHELRTPLTSINGYIQLLMSRSSNFDPQVASWVNHLSWEGVRLTNLIKELLEINKIRSGHLQYMWKECSLREVIGRAIENFKFIHPNREVVFIDYLGSNSDKVVGDFDKLLQVITNLVDNSIKFSSPETAVSITLKNQQNDLTIKVVDKGKGVDKKDVGRLFEGFYKGSDHTKEGMGLGLYICKTIILSHHGEIKINTKLNKGTTVEISLPISHL